MHMDATVAKQIDAKYIFLDIVKYSLNRSIEAQTEIINAMNDIVRRVIESQIPDFVSRIIYIPTGDGLCIALKNTSDIYDIHIQIASEILKEIALHNESTEDEMRKFKVRIGINEGTDNLIIDINNNLNIAGSGITLAQRIMNETDPSQIFVSETVYAKIHYWEKYMSAFKRYFITTKHAETIAVYQLAMANLPGLNIDIPEKFKPTDREDAKLSEYAAYYFVFAIIHEKSLIKLLSDEKIYVTEVKIAATIYYNYLANNELKKMAATPINPQVYPAKISFEEIQKYGNEYYFTHFKNDMFNLFGRTVCQELKDFRNLMEYGYNEAAFIKKSGKEKLKKEHPSIWEKFDLDNSETDLLQKESQSR